MGSQTKPVSALRRAGLGGKVAGTLFLGAFLLGGLLFCAVLLRESCQAVRPFTWEQVDCVVRESRVDEGSERRNSSAPYQFVVAYEYMVEGKTYRSDQFTTRRVNDDDYRGPGLLAERYPVGASATCYVNPDNPAEAVLQRKFPWMLLALAFPLIFVAIGGGGIYFVWRGARPDEAKQEAISARAESASAGAKRAGCFLIPFFSIFLVVGLIVFFALFIRPLFKLSQAKGWVETPCVVVLSRLQRHQSDDSTSYSADILYSYEFQGREHRSNRYGFANASGGHSRARRIVSRYRPGTEAVCYVNPQDPTEAVLVRELTSDIWLGLIPLVFVLVGAGGLAFGVRKVRQKGGGRASRSAGQAAAFAAPAEAAGPVELKPKASPLVKLFGMILFTLFWNGIVSVFVGVAVKAWMEGSKSFMERWFLPIFLIPFVLVGLFLIGALIHTFLALFNPRLRLRVSSSAVPLGGSLQLEWRVAGNTRRLQRLRLYLEGREEATYRQGTRSRTDTSRFAEIELVNATNWTDMASGQAKTTVPADTMHSLAGTHNKVVWALQVRGEIPRWPDISDEYPIQILPAPVRR